jgi:hypothetical protein
VEEGGTVQNWQMPFSFGFPVPVLEENSLLPFSKPAGKARSAFANEL